MDTNIPDTNIPDTNIPVQKEVFTERLLSPDMVEKLLTEFAKIDGITRLILHGPRIASTVPTGPAKGTPNVHAARKHIQVGQQDVELGVQAVSYTHLRAHETDSYLVCRLLLEKKKKKDCSVSHEYN